MARFSTVSAATEGRVIRVRFECDSPGVIGWQLFDPSSGAFLLEGEWSSMNGRQAHVDIALPPEDGPYRVQVAPVEDRSSYIAIDAQVGDDRVAISEPRIASAASERWARLVRAVPRAFTVPATSIWRNRKLIGSMVRRDVTARYRGSIGGTLWTVLNPLLLMATYFFVFGVVLQSGTRPQDYVLYLLSGFLSWLPFSEAVGRSPSVILEYRNFVQKLVFPIETLPVNLVLAGLVTEVFGLAIFCCGLLILRGSIPGAVVWLPVLLVPQILLTLGVSWFLSATGVFVRDLGQIIGFLLTLAFFLTPICWVVTDAVPELARNLLEWNPMYLLVRGYRAVLLENRAPEVGGLWVASAAVAVVGHAWFHRLRKSFADVI